MTPDPTYTPRHVTPELCEARHGEVMRGMNLIERKLDALYELVGGNGQPGLRETQSELRAVQKELQRMRTLRDSWAMMLVRPILPLLYGAALAGIYVHFGG